MKFHVLLGRGPLQNRQQTTRQQSVHGLAKAGGNDNCQYPQIYKELDRDSDIGIGYKLKIPEPLTISLFGLCLRRNDDLQQHAM